MADEDRPPTPAEEYHVAAGHGEQPEPGVPPPVAPPEDRYVLLLAALDEIAAGNDPERTGPAYAPRPGEYPLGTLVRFTVPGRKNMASRDRGVWDEPEQTGLGLVIEYALVGPAETRPHMLLCDDGTYRQVDRAHLTEA